jgi:hypothetical protein
MRRLRLGPCSLSWDVWVRVGGGGQGKRCGVGVLGGAVIMAGTPDGKGHGSRSGGQLSLFSHDGTPAVSPKRQAGA